MAVQISTPADPYLSPGLSGHSPGDPDGQSILLVDNNKAQRNLGVSLNVAHFAGIHFALLHNPALFRRDMVLRYESPAKTRWRERRSRSWEAGPWTSALEAPSRWRECSRERIAGSG